MSVQQTLDTIMALEDLFTDEEKAVRDSIREWVTGRFLPQLTEHHRAGTFPTELLSEIGEIGAFGANIEGYGCAGLNNVSYGLVMQELERGDSGLRSLCSVQGALVMYPILTFGNDDQRNKYLPKLATGEMVGCFGLTEPNAGSDPASMKTFAVKDGDHYVLNGEKAWITNSPIAHVAVIWAKDRSDGDRIRGFIVERGTAGFETPYVEGKFSLRASPTGEIVLNDCRIPAENVLPESNGLKSPLMCLTQAREGIAWGITGPALDCFETVLQYGIDRIAFDQPIANFQLYQHKLAEMATMITNSQLMNLHFGRLKDAGKLTPVQVSMHKRHNVEKAREIASMARGMLGGIGITDAYPVIRHMMNIESVYTYEGTHEVHTLALGRALTGLNAFA
ncbi:MAG: acyl-CoA dehydrogenase [Deltaproteobacteria bacterium]|nr:acyl-CoA dehydrogenase [Deltaproteobacteria bacterium]MBT6489765.1 acyl-CoA dehydrogenase [Deltaproteobacteria bacterium]